MTADRNAFESLGFGLLLAIIALSPLPFGSNRPAAWFLLYTSVGVALLLWVAAGLVRQGRMRVPFRWFRWDAGLFLLLAAWFLVQAWSGTPSTWHHPIWAAGGETLQTDLTGSISASRQDTIAGLLRFVAYGGVFFLAMQFGRSHRRARLAIGCVVITGVVYSIYGLIIKLGGFDTILWYKRWAYEDSLTSTFVNRNNFATFGGLTLIGCAGLLTRIRRRAESDSASTEGTQGEYLERFATQGILLALGAIIILTAILLSHSRAGLLATALALAAFYFCGRHRRGGGDRLVPLLLSVTLFAVVAISGAVTWQRLDRETSVDIVDRWQIYGDTIEAIGKRPWLGHGLGTYREVFEGHRSFQLWRAQTLDKAHNSYLEFFFEAGLPAGMLLLLLWSRIFLRCLCGVRRRRRDSVYPAIAIGAGVLLACHSLVDFPIQIPAVATLFIFLMGIGYAQSWPSATNSEA
ncbi:MAG: O-antigen ligase family protein [Alphaproteobacteria bacterium]|nr:O-antigen ligase family protein [Alphaproteobacteria bacterium]